MLFPANKPQSAEEHLKHLLFVTHAEEALRHAAVTKAHVEARINSMFIKGHEIMCTSQSDL